MRAPETIKKCMLLCLLIMAAWTDSREMRISNKLLGAACGLWLLFPVTEWFLTGERVLIRYGALLAKSLLLVLALVCLVILSRCAIGFGDVKLLGAVSLYGGPGTALDCLAYGLLLAGGVSLVLLASGRLGIRDRLPLAPFFLAGYALTLLA